MGSLDTYFGDYIPYAYPSLSEVVIPTVGDPNGHLTGNQELFVFTDIGDWLEGTAGAGLPYVPLPDGADPNTRSYEFTDGNSPDLPGFIVMHTEPGMPVEDLIVFNPDADPNDYPFEVTRPDLLFSGRLYLQSDDTFTSEEYNGYLMHADADRSGTVDFNDFALMADMWTEDVGTAGPIPETP